MKRRKHFELSNSTKSCEYPVVAICEESDTKDSQFKSNPFMLIQTLYSFFAGKGTSGLAHTLFYKYFSYTSSDRYLLFEVVRI